MLTHSARVAIYLMLKHGLPPKSKVAVTAFTLSDVINMLFCAGHEPVFVDTDKMTGALDEQAFFELAEAGGVDAILLTHFFGTMHTTARLIEYCETKGIQIFEDAAQVFGGKGEAGAAGSHGLASAFSFGRLKPTSSIRGGCVLTDDEDLYIRMKSEQQQWPAEGFIAALKEAVFPFIIKTITLKPVFNLLTFWIFRFGVTKDIDVITSLLKIERNPKKFTSLPENFVVRPHPAFFAVLHREIERFSENVVSRGRVAAHYVEEVAGCEQVSLYNLRPGNDVLYVLAASVKEPGGLRSFLYQKNKEISVCYHKNCAALPCFSEHAAPASNAAMIERTTIYLPCNPDMQRSAVAKIVKDIASYYQQ